MNIQLSINPSCVGKDGRAMGAKVWQTASLSLDALRDHVFTQGKAIAPGLFDGPDKTAEKWRGSQLVIIDIDTFTPEHMRAIDDAGGIIPFLLSVPYVANHAAFIKPSSSYTHQTPKVHIFFPLDRVNETEKAYRALHAFVSAQIPLESDPALARPAQGVFGTVYKSGDEKHISQTYINPDATPIPVTLTMRVINVAYRDLLPFNDSTFQDNAGQHATRSMRSEKHYAQSDSDKVRLTLEALSWALRGWGRKSYDEWLALIFSAYDGADGSKRVRDYIAAHPDITWDDEERRAFVQQWDEHKPRRDEEKRVTVASLFMFARRNGWLQTSYVDLTDEDYTDADIDDIGQWLIDNEHIQRLLLLSATGTGKTRGVAAYIKHKLSTQTLDGKVVLFAPSVKLCEDLHATLTSMDIEATLYIDGDKTKDHDTLRNARILVTTLQTFAIKVVQRGIDIDAYSLAVVDESDELIGGFVRSGIAHGVGSYRSHVKKQQSRWGMEALYKILSHVPRVFFLDGTATRVSLTALQRFSKDKEIHCIRNTRAPDKASVVMLPDLLSARHKAIEAVRDGLRVVIATDTRREANTLYTFLVENGLVPKDEIIQITSGTSGNKAVRAFFRDVNAGALRYRVVVYNSAMGSGVSITSVEPDVIVQIGTYVSARKHLQILNRYRRQATVYAYIMRHESLYTENIEDTVQRVQRVIDMEASQTLDRRERSEIATITLELAQLSVGDEMEQRRNRELFYRGLLEKDNRKVTVLDTVQTPDTLADEIKDIHARIAERKQVVYSLWPDVEPIERGKQPQDIDEDTLLAGLLHTRIINTLQSEDNVKAALHEFSPEYLADIVHTHARNVWKIERWLEPQKALDASIQDMHVQNRVPLAFGLWVSRLDLIAQTRHLFASTDDILTDEDADTRYMHYLEEIRQREDTYNAFVGDNRHMFHKVYTTYEDKQDLARAALVMCRAVLARVGLSVRRKTVQQDGERIQVWTIQDRGLFDLMRLRGHDITSLTFDNPALDEAKRKTAEARAVFKRLDKTQQAAVMARMDTLGDTFYQAVNVASLTA